MDLGMCTSQNDVVEKAAAAGYRHVERATATALAVADDAWPALRDEILAAPLPTPVCNLFFPRETKIVGPARDLPQTVEYVDKMLGRLAEIGTTIQVFGSGGARQVPEGYSVERAFDEMVELCTAIGPVAARHGVVIAMEHLRAAECNLLTTFAETAEFVRRVNHPAVRLLADGFHMAQMNESYDVLRSCGDLLVHVHLADPATRSEPAHASSDFRPIFRGLKAAGYDGRISLECGWKDMANTLKPSYDLVVAQWNEC